MSATGYESLYTIENNFLPVVLGLPVEILSRIPSYGQVVILILVGVFLGYVYGKLGSKKRLPPGPRGFPLVGALPLMGRKPYLTVQRWWDQYGDVVSMYMGSRLVVIVNGIEAMKECFVKQGDTFTGRPWNYLKKLTKGKGIVFSDGEVWREHRRFTLSCLRDFGMGRVVLEEKIREEAGHLINVVSDFAYRPFDPAQLITKGVSNIISSIIYGSRFDYNDPVFLANLTALSQSTRNQTLMSLINFIPILEFLPKILPNDKMLLKNVRLRQEYAKRQLERHRETFDRENPRDFIDAYLARLQELTENGEETTFDESQLERAIQDLYIAGTETVSVTLRWSLLFLALHPEVQAKVQDEIDRIVGPTRKPSLQDRPNLPYTQATVLECQRRGNVVLFSVPRCATQDATLSGYHVPKGAWVFANRWGLHASTRYWEDPEKFRPENFLDSEGRVRQPDTFAPFGMGPRSCIGASLAQMEIFIFLTAILQSFSLHLPDDQLKPDLEPKAGLNLAPGPYEIIARRR